MDQGIDFSTITHHQDLHGYIPQVQVPGFVYPLLAADVSGVDSDLIGWRDHRQGFNPHNLIHDMEQIINQKHFPPGFSIVQQYDPRDLR
jgi:hypothetical protein